MRQILDKLALDSRTMKQFRKVSIIISVFTFLNIVKGQPNLQCEGMNRGRNFVITFPGNYDGDADSIELSVLVVALGDNTTSVTLSSNFDSFQSTFEIEPMRSSWVSIPSEFALSMRSEKSNKVIEVVADSEISVYGLNYQRVTTNVILGIPTDSLEDNYVQMGVVESIDSPSLFVVAGVKEDYTQVEVNLTASVTFEGQTYPAGSPIEFRVAQNEVVQIVADSDEGTIEGITVESDQPIVLLSGYVCSSSHSSPCSNPMEGDSATSLGANYVYDTTGSRDARSIFAIQAYYSDTIVNVPGFDPVSLQPGESLQSEVTNNEAISTSRPVSAVQVSINTDSMDASTLKIIPGCSLVTCPVLDISVNLVVEESGYFPGSTLRFTCAEGYTLIGSSEVTCDESGTWSSQFPECSREYLFESWLVGIIIACCSVTLIVVMLVIYGVVKQKRQTSSYFLEQPE